MRTVLTLALSVGLLVSGSIAEAQVAMVRPLATRPLAVYVAPTSTTASTTTSSPAPAPRPGELRCDVLENGIYAPASIEVRQAGRVVASGSCATPVVLPAGTYAATITLESALDRPARTVNVVVPDGGAAVARASFETAMLEVRFTNDGAPVPGLAILRRGGVQVGTIGSGVAARVSAGTYEIVARYRTVERTYSVALSAGQRRAVRADF